MVKPPVAVSNLIPAVICVFVVAFIDNERILDLRLVSAKSIYRTN